MHVLAGLLFLIMFAQVLATAAQTTQRKTANGGHAYRGWHRWTVLPLLLLLLLALALLRMADDRNVSVVLVAVCSVSISTILLLIKTTNEKSYVDSDLKS